jgi:hypothetical protein
MRLQVSNVAWIADVKSFGDSRSQILLRFQVSNLAQTSQVADLCILAASEGQQEQAKR